MIPITILTGFLGAGKTTLILNLIPQLPTTYRLALLKNEFGDLAIDSELASSSSISGVQELLNGCICCNLVGQLQPALDELRTSVKPDRIIIETSGSAFPATLAMEVNRIARETGNYNLDGVVSVIDCENWQGYEDKSITAKMQAQYTDLIVLSKWEELGERRVDEVLDRVGDLETQTAVVKSEKGKVPADLLLGLDGALAKKLGDGSDSLRDNIQTDAGHGHKHEHGEEGHQSEVEVLSIALLSAPGARRSQAVDIEGLETFLLSAPKDEIYRIKAIVRCSSSPTSSDGTLARKDHPQGSIKRYILNWAFGRWTFSPVKSIEEIEAIPMPKKQDSEVISDEGQSHEGTMPTMSEPPLRMTIITAKYESEKWRKRLVGQGHVKVEGTSEDGSVGGELRIQRVL
jgi:G3E family GTPase